MQNCYHNCIISQALPEFAEGPLNTCFCPLTAIVPQSFSAERTPDLFNSIDWGKQ
ncbi:hypothetical protein HMPREF1548_05358 [Clostridium sp. KLE 1755]|nr:hypothetical protein HMPREF1548_05358 [Clostridium sp. KLE 1755]